MFSPKLDRVQFICERLVSFLFEFIIAPVVVPVVIAIIIPLLEFLIPLIAVIAVSAAVPFTILLGPEGLDIRRIRKLQLTAGERR